jgi:uncharacterized phiE125 gp8 family phage protein
MRLEPLAAVAVEPVSLAQAKLWLRVDHDAEDGLITALISAARDYVEAQTGLALAPQTWRLAVRPSALPVELPRPPFGALLSAEALLGDGTTRAVPLGIYWRSAWSRPWSPCAKAPPCRPTASSCGWSMPPRSLLVPRRAPCRS